MTRREHDATKEVLMDDALLETISEKVHEAWAAEKVKQGFADHPSGMKFYPGEGIGPCCYKQHHADMLPYADLAENVKDYDRATVRAVFGAIEAAGYAVVTVDRLRQLGTAVAMLNSMLLCGEQHSDTSRRVVQEAMSAPATNEKSGQRVER